MRFMSIVALLGVVVAGAPAWAQSGEEPLLPGSKGAETQPRRDPEPGPLPERQIQPRSGDQAEEGDQAEGEESPDDASGEVPRVPQDPRPKRGLFDFATLFGLGAVSMPGTNTESGFAPGIFIGHRSSFLYSSQFGVRWSTRAFFHDFQAIGDYYGWYNQGSAEEVELKYALLWPGLLFGPFVGANYGTGLGFVVYTSPYNPALYFDFGIGFDLYLNPSDSDFVADVGLSVDGTIGVDFNSWVGLGATFSWGTPFFHGTFDGDVQDIPSLVLFLSLL